MRKYSISNGIALVILSVILGFLMPFIYLVMDDPYWRFVFWMMIAAFTLWLVVNTLASRFRLSWLAPALLFLGLSVVFFDRWRVADRWPVFTASLYETLADWRNKTEAWRSR